MKKFLLSLALVAGTSAFVSAEVVDVNFANASDITETTNVTNVTVDGVNFGMVNCKTSQYQNIKFLQVSGKNKTPKGYMTFSFDKKLTGFVIKTGASGSINVQVQLSANDVAVGDPVKLDAQNANFSFAIPEANQTAGTVYKVQVIESSNYNAQVSTMSFTLDEAFTGGGSTPVDPNPVDPTPTPSEGDIDIIKVTEFSVADAKFAFVFNEGIVGTFAESANFGYWVAKAATLADNMKTNKEYIFDIASTADGYTIKDTYGRIMGWDGSHWSFNVYATAAEGNSYWDIAMVDGKVKISNKANSNVYLCGKVYNNTSYEMCPTDRADQALPYLYKVNSSSVAEVAADQTGEAVYFNLQGVKVQNPENGLFIKVQNGKSSKVLVK